jgi:cytochrome d ubiquinol oxidase subunit II
MDLITLWFIVIAVFWTGFFFLEGFDFGVGMLTRLTGRDDAERRQMLSAIGPVWGADEVWLIMGGISIFAAFPLWYAAVFPAAYIPLFLVIAALAIRGIAIEYRSKRPDHRWREAWDVALAIASLLLPLLFGAFWAGMLHGIPIDESGTFVGESLFSFLTPFAILGGLTLVVFSLAHGATFLALKTSGDVEQRQVRLARPLTAIALVLMVVFATWTAVEFRTDHLGVIGLGALAALGLLVALIAHGTGRVRIAFWANGVSIASFVALIFVGLYPNALPSTLDDGYTLTLETAAASPYSLRVITIVTAIALPVVIAYQAWSFWVFRKRVARPGPADSGH